MNRGNTSCLGAVDVRAKLVLLLAYSITLFVVHSWLGIVICASVLALCIFGSKVSPKQYFSGLIPLYVLLAFTIFFNAYSINADVASFSLSGFDRGCLYAARVMLLVLASLVVTFTTTDTTLTWGLSRLMAPLRVLRVPVDDVAMTLTLALRFIPVFSEELETLKKAQLSRGAALDCGNLVVRMRAWLTIMIPLFVGLFRRADQLSQAMDARCYGLSDKPRTSLVQKAFTLRNSIILIGGLAFLIVVGLCLLAGNFAVGSPRIDS